MLERRTRESSARGRCGTYAVRHAVRTKLREISLSGATTFEPKKIHPGVGVKATTTRLPCSTVLVHTYMLFYRSLAMWHDMAVGNLQVCNYSTVLSTHILSYHTWCEVEIQYVIIISPTAPEF